MIHTKPLTLCQVQSKHSNVSKYMDMILSVCVYVF